MTTLAPSAPGAVPLLHLCASISCVIVAFHRKDALCRLLARLRGHGLEIVVVNVENDPEISAAAEGCRIVGLPDNPGFAAAVNAGVTACSAPVVVFMNDDVECEPVALAVLADAIRAGAGVAVPRVVDVTGRTEPTISALPGVGALVKEWLTLPDRPVRVLDGRIRVEKWRRPVATERIRAASAAIVAVPRDLITDIPLPEEYFLYWEESEWFFRLAQLQVRVEYTPDSVAVHHGGRNDVRPAKARLLARNAVRCIRRTRGRPAACGAYPVVVAWWTRLLVVDFTKALVGRRAWPVVKARLVGLAAAVSAWREVVR